MSDLDSSSSSDDDLLYQCIFLAVGMDNNEGEDAKEQVLQIDMYGWRELSNASFKENFRMDRIVFERLVQEVGRHMVARNLLRRKRTPLDLRLLMALWPIFNPDTFRSSGHSYGKKKGSIYSQYQLFIRVLRQMAPRYIKWPTPFERENIKTSFEERYGFPGTVGAIDGTHIPITAPNIHPQDYVGRNRKYSVLVQAVCDDRLLYRDLYVGQPGSIGDVRNFNKSPLSLNLLLSEDMLSEDEHIIGDSAYVCTKQLLTPYINDGNLDQRQRLYNHSLSATRSCIERSFGLLKGKERRLYHLYMRNFQNVVDHISASAVIHNFIILEGEDSNGLPAINVRRINNDEYNRLVAESRDIGAHKREYISRTIFG